MNEYSIQENIVNISMKAAELLKDGKIQADDVEGHVGMTQTIVQLAKAFEKQHEGTDWELPFTPDYWEAIDQFAEEQLLERYGIVREAPENTVSLWARVGMTLNVPQGTYERLKAGDHHAMQEVLDGEVGEVLLDGQTYFPDIEQNVGLEDMEFNLPVSKAQRTITPELSVPDNDPVKVYAVAGAVKREIYSGTLDECNGFCKASNWTYTDENRFEWALEMEDTRVLPKTYFDAVAHYSRDTGTDIDCDFTRQHADELVYCYQNGKSLVDFDFWTRYEELLKEKISYKEYAFVDSRYNDDPLEVNPDDRNAVEGMKLSLAFIRARDLQNPKADQVTPSLEDKIQDAQSRQAQQDSVNMKKEMGPEKDPER